MSWISREVSPKIPKPGVKEPMAGYSTGQNGWTLMSTRSHLDSPCQQIEFKKIKSHIQRMRKKSADSIREAAK